MATKKHVNPGNRNDPTIAKLMNIAKNCEESVFQKNTEYVKFKANKKITFSEIDLLQNGLCKFCDFKGETKYPEERIYWAKRVLEEKVGDKRERYVSLKNLIHVYFEIREYDLALEYGQKPWLESSDKEEILQDLKLVSCLATSAKILRRFKESIPYDKQRLKLMSKAYQAGKLKYKKIADQEGDHLGWELLNCYKDLISSQIQCNQFEDAMKTFKKMKLYKLDSMNPRDVQECIDLLYDRLDPNKSYRNQSSMANDFLHYHVFGVLFGLKAQALYGLGDITNGDIWLNDTLDLCVSFHQTFSQMVSMVSTENNPGVSYHIGHMQFLSEDGSISEMFFVQLVHTFLMASEYAFSRINGISFESEEGIRSDVKRRQYFQHLMGHLFSGNLFAKSKHASYYIGSVMKNQFVKFETVIPFIEHFIRCLNEKSLEQIRKETKETDSTFSTNFNLSGRDQRKKNGCLQKLLDDHEAFQGFALIKQLFSQSTMRCELEL